MKDWPSPSYVCHVLFLSCSCVFAGSGADFQGGHTHAGILNSAHWLLKNETLSLRRLLEENPTYSLHFIGHSLGAGSKLISIFLNGHAFNPFS